MKTVIKNAHVVLPDCSGFVDADLLVCDGKIAEIGQSLSGDVEYDAKGKYLLPGLIDVHNHGAIGVYYGSEEDPKALGFLAKCGVTTVLPTFGTHSIDKLVERIRFIIANKEKHEDIARIGGIHMEGPFVSTEKRGALAVAPLTCNKEDFIRLVEAGEGEVRIMTIAPELEGALDIIREGAKRGVRMSLGHTMATYDEAMAGIEAGATHATHTFNAMRAYNHREPGVLGAVLTDERVSCETICDMVHLSPVTVKLIRLAKGLDKMILVSDSGLITGVPNGEYVIDGQTRYVKDGVSRTANGTIAGSCFTMADDARNLVKIGFTLPEIARIGALNPARAAKIDDYLGTLEVGKCADVLVCDEEMNIERVMIRGKFI